MRVKYKVDNVTPCGVLSTRFSPNAISTHPFLMKNHSSAMLPLPVIPFSTATHKHLNIPRVRLRDFAEALASAISKTYGLDVITIKHISSSCPKIVQPLTSMFNSAIITSPYPSLWKLILITPIPKVPTSSDAFELRLITKLSECSKLLEKILAKQLACYLEEHDLLL